MLQLVNVGTKSLLDYVTIASRGLMEEIRRLSDQVEGKRVLHLSATAFGGGVAEINYALVPLMRDAGLDVEWRIVRDPQPAFVVEHFPSSQAHWIWRCHIDLSAPNESVLDFLLPALGRYDAAIFHMNEYAPKTPGLPPAYIWPPAI